MPRRTASAQALVARAPPPMIVRAGPPPFLVPRSLPMSAAYDVLGIGNAIVDVIARTEDDFLVKHGMNKGAMALIDEARAEAIYASMGQATQSSGGSGANTIAGVAS